VRLGRWRQVEGEARNAGEAVGEHHGATVELGDVTAAPEDDRGVWSMVSSWRKQWQRGIGDRGADRKSLEPADGSPKWAASAQSS
jgi:hypothetical protein